MILLYLLLFIIAIGVLLLSEAGKKVLRFLGIGIVVFAGVIFLGIIALVVYLYPNSQFSNILGALIGIILLSFLSLKVILDIKSNPDWYKKHIGKTLKKSIIIGVAVLCSMILLVLLSSLFK